MWVIMTLILVPLIIFFALLVIQNRIIKYYKKDDIKIERNYDSNLVNEQKEKFYDKGIEFSKISCQFSFWLNGMASVSILTFIGYLANNNISTIYLFADALRYLGVGAAMAALTTIGIYYSLVHAEWAYNKIETQSFGRIWNVSVKFEFIATVLLLSSFVLFFIGSICFCNGLKNLSKSQSNNNYQYQQTYQQTNIIQEESK